MVTVSWERNTEGVFVSVYLNNKRWGFEPIQLNRKRFITLTTRCHSCDSSLLNGMKCAKSSTNNSLCRREKNRFIIKIYIHLQYISILPKRKYYGTRYSKFIAHKFISANRFQRNAALKGKLLIKLQYWIVALAHYLNVKLISDQSCFNLIIFDLNIYIYICLKGIVRVIVRRPRLNSQLNKIQYATKCDKPDMYELR